MPAHDDPRQAILDALSAPRIIVSDEPVPGKKGVRKLVTQGGMGAKAETIRFLKERQLPGCQLYYLAYEDEQGRAMEATYYVVQVEEGQWHVRGAAGGSRGGKELAREQPWVNLGGGWRGLQDFYAGGRVITNGPEIACVRLRAANGTILEDTVDEGVVLFLGTQPVERPLHAELYDRQGVLVASHATFKLPPHPPEQAGSQLSCAPKAPQEG